MEVIDTDRRKRLERASLAFCLGSALPCVVVYWLTAPLDTRGEIEQQLERPVLAFAVWEGTTYVVVEYGDSIHFDRLILDPISLEWPPLSRWQWSGEWSSLPVTHDPAIVARSDRPIPGVLFGQANEPTIVSMEVAAGGTTRRFAVSGPAFLLRYEGTLPPTTEVSWLDQDDNVVWTSRVEDG